MKLKIIFLLPVLLAVFLSFISCNNEKRKNVQILENVEKVINQHPDSALKLLNSIIYPEDLNKKQYNRYKLLEIQAKDKNYKDISKDTIIYKVRDYYAKRNDTKKLAIANFYCGQVSKENKRFEEAMQYFLDAEKYAVEAKDPNQAGLANSLIGHLLYTQFSKKKAIGRFKKSVEYFVEAGNYKNEVSSYMRIGNSFFVLSENDSAFFYFNKGLEVADLHNYEEGSGSTRSNLGVVYREIGEFDKSLYYLKEALKFNNNSINKAKTYLNISKAFHQKSELDSCVHYLQKSLTIKKERKDLPLLGNIYNMLSKIEEEQENYQKALSYYKDYTKNMTEIVEENRDRAIWEIQEKYNFEVIRNDNIQLKLQRQKAYFYSITFILILVLITIYFYYKYSKNKRIAIEAEDKIYALMEMSRDFDEKKNTLRNILLQHFNILKKAALLEIYLKKEDRNSNFIKKVNEIVYGQDTLNWDTLYQTMNDLNNGLFDKLHYNYPQLDEIEFRICCMLYAKFSSAEISIITRLSVNTVNMKRTSIRKKLGIESFGSISDYLNKHLF